MKHNCKAKLERAGVDFSGEGARMRRTMSVHTGVGSAIAGEIYDTHIDYSDSGITLTN